MKTWYMYHIPANGEFPITLVRSTEGDEIDIDNFTLEELRNGVGGHIERLPLVDDEDVEGSLVVNESGKLFGFEPNFRATVLYRFGEHDVLAGDALLVTTMDLHIP